MASRKTSAAADCATTRTISSWAYSVRANLSLKPGSRGSKRVAWDLFVNMNCLRMLSKVVKTRESSIAVTLKWPLSSMLSVYNMNKPQRFKGLQVVYIPNVASQMLTPSEA
jgi:hypothetical protein